MSDLRMRFPGGLSRALTLSYDDGVEQDEQLLDIMARHGLRGTFNLYGSLLCIQEPAYPAGQIHRRVSRAKALPAAARQRRRPHAAQSHGGRAVAEG